jgi:predicted MFS family arabinose efflux permease
MSPPSRTVPRSGVAALLILFGSLYFVQGIIEPTACLPAQPVQTELRAWGFIPTQVGHFFGIIGIAWSIKPLFGLISDFFPLGGYRRWPYLLLSTAATSAAFLALAALWSRPTGPVPGWLSDAFRWLAGTTADQPDLSQIGWLLLIVAIGVATTDVAIDALAVETGQPLGITGQIQAVQWGAMSVAGLIIGTLGGYVAQHHLQRAMFGGCGLLAGVSLIVVLAAVREPRQSALPHENLREAWRQLGSGRRLLILLLVAALLFLWNFNPFSSNVQQDYLTKELHFSEQFYGNLLSVQSIGTTIACVAYFFYCRRVPLGLLVHLSIVTGVASTLTYWLVHDAASAVAASLIFGLAYQTGLLIQLDLAARICPTESAGTMFALLMAISNTGTTFGIYLGGGWYDGLAAGFDSRALAFHTLVGIGAAFTAACWLIVPLMKWAGVEGK